MFRPFLRTILAHLVQPRSQMAGGGGGSYVRQFWRNWVRRGYLVAVTRCKWLLRGIRGCYGVYVLLCYAKITLRGSYGTGFTSRCDRGINIDSYGVTSVSLHIKCVIDLQGAC